MKKSINLPRILIIDDLFGRTHSDQRNAERAHLCGKFQIEDVTGDEAGMNSKRIKHPIAQAVFCRGQRPVSSGIGDVVENDLDMVIETAARGWSKAPYWSLVLLDLCFYTGQVTEESDESTTGMPEGRTGDDTPQGYFGLKILAALGKRFPGLPIVILSSKPRGEVSREFSMRGAAAFIPRADENAGELLKEYLYKYGLIPDETGEIIGRSKALLLALNAIRRSTFAGDRRNILIRGERGTGKELIAKYIHRQRSRGKTNPFVVVNSSALTESLFASLLFGIEANVASGVTARIGFIRDAEGGDLFFDEIRDMPPQVQAGLLRVLQEKRITPVGSSKSVQVDTAFLSATNINIEALAAEGFFRPDLLDRLREGGTVLMPPLRERLEDIPLLVERFVKEAESTVTGAHPRTIEPEAIDKLMQHNWPGNIRELRDCIMNAVAQFPDVEHLVPSHINIQHSAQQTAVAISKASIGVDKSQHGSSSSTIAVQLGRAFKENSLPSILERHNLEIVSYIGEVLERTKRNNGEPNYPQAWQFLTGNYVSNSSMCQRNIGNYIFSLRDEQIIQLANHYVLLGIAALQCGEKIVSARKRLPALREALHLTETIASNNSLRTGDLKDL